MLSLNIPYMKRKWGGGGIIDMNFVSKYKIIKIYVKNSKM